MFMQVSMMPPLDAQIPAVIREEVYSQSACLEQERRAAEVHCCFVQKKHIKYRWSPSIIGIMLPGFFFSSDTSVSLPDIGFVNILL